MGKYIFKGFLSVVSLFILILFAVMLLTTGIAVIEVVSAFLQSYLLWSSGLANLAGCGVLAIIVAVLNKKYDLF